MNTLPTVNLFAPMFSIERNEKGKFIKGNSNRFQSGNTLGTGNHNAGRPGKYNEEVQRKAEAYLQHCKTQKQIPFIQELALELHVSRDTIHSWRTAKNDDGELLHGAFSDLCEYIDTFQELAIIKRGLAGKAPSFAQFLLETKHKYIKTEKQILTGDKENPVEQTLHIEIVEAKTHE